MTRCTSATVRFDAVLKHVPVQEGLLESVPVVGVVGEPPEHATRATAENGNSKFRHARLCEICLMIQRVRPQAPVWFRGDDPIES